jgi:hypothetical protein
MKISNPYAKYVVPIERPVVPQVRDVVNTSVQAANPACEVTISDAAMKLYRKMGESNE